MSSSSDALSVMLDSKSTTSLTISWTLFGGVTATGYTISYSNTNNTECFTANTVIPDSESDTMYRLTGLEEGTEYSITVTATLSGGGTGERQPHSRHKDCWLVYLTEFPVSSLSSTLGLQLFAGKIF